MNTLRFIAALTLAFLLFLSAAQANPTAGKKRKKDADEIFPAIGPAARLPLCDHDSCIELWARFAGDFFEKLEVKGSPDAPVFLLDSHPAEYFPEALTLQIIAFGRGNRTGLHWGIFTSPPSTRQPPPPPPNLQTRQVTDTPLTHETMMGLWFKAEWKHNGEVRPVSDLTWEESYNVWRGLAPAEWYYTLTFSARDVPLTDTLVITVFEDGGKQIASLDATVPLGVLPYVHNDKKRD